MIVKPIAAALMAGVLFLQAPAASTWYVDDDNYGKSGLDGKTEATAYGTIQDAVVAAAAGDTILVLPGVYDKGYADPNTATYKNAQLKHRARVAIYKNNLTIKSTGGREVTHIVGAFDPSAAADKYGAGANSVACVKILRRSGTTYYSFTLDGFTIRDGACYMALSSTYDNGAGIGFWNGDTWRNADYVHVFDCTVSNCVSRCGAVNSCTLHRCLVTDNRAWYNGGVNSALVHCKAENTVIRGGGSRPVLKSTLVNCLVTGADIATEMAADAGPVCSSIIAFNNKDRDASSGYPIFTNSVTTGRGRYAFYTKVYNSHLGTEGDETATNLFVSPLLCDYRLIAGSYAENRGTPGCLSHYIKLPTGYTFKDYYGNPIDMTAEHIHAGVSQTVVETKGGCTYFAEEANVSNGWYLVNGRSLYGGNYNDNFCWATEWPTQWCVTASDPSAHPFVRVAESGGYTHLPTTNGQVRIFPAASGSVKKLTVDCAALCSYVDPVNGSDAYDGSCAWEDAVTSSRKGPWKTLMMAATNDVLDKTRLTLVRCAPGSYSDGVHSAYGLSRLYVPSDRRLHFAGTEGAEKTFVVGAPDTSVKGGQGSKSVRCIYNTSATTTFSGLTLTNGYNSGENIWPNYFGSAIYSTAATTLADSRVVGCYGREGAVNGPEGDFTLERCLIRGNYGSTYIANGCRFVGCILRDNVAASSYGWFYNKGTLFGCTVYLTSATTEDQVVTDSSLSVYNTVFVNARKVDNVAVGRGCVFDNCTGTHANFSHSVTGSVCIARPSIGDYRLVAGSDAWGVAETDVATYAGLIGTDYYGTPMVVDGKIPAAGAVVTRAPNGVGIKDPYGTLTVTGIPSGANDIREGETVTVAQNANSSRPVIAVVLNGVTNIFTQVGQSYSYSYEDVVALGGSLTVVPIVTCDWYVNANQDAVVGIVGSDSNTGFSPYFPKRSLKAAVAKAVSGDTVHAAEGDYNYLTMNAVVSKQPSRVEVPAGVSLVADGAREKTFIRGAAGSGTGGLGSGAVRCVYLAQGASVTGFTIIDGHLVSVDASNFSTTVNGGAVCSYGTTSSTNAFVNDCVINNCKSMRAVTLGGTFRRCKFVGCSALRGFLSAYSAFYNTIFTGNVMGDGSAKLNHVSSFENCIYAGDNVWTDGTAATTNSFVASPGFVRNTVIFATLDDVAAMNCAFGIAGVVSGKTKFVNCVEMSADDMALDENFKPTFGKSKLIDRGTNDCDSARNYETWGGTDIAGLPRISNGSIDIGPYEADWRPQYSKDICWQSAVTEAAPCVFETALADGRKSVALGQDGTLLLACERKEGERSLFRFALFVTGNGVLTVAPEGGETQTFTYAEGLQVCTVSGTGPQNVLLTYTPGENDPGTAQLFRSGTAAGLVIIGRQ